MAKLFFGSDQHFFHKRIMELCPTTRHGESLEEMHELLIQEHNKLVKKEDTVWFLGDLSFGTVEKTISVLRRLNGKLSLVRGNHDHWISVETSMFFDEIVDYKVLKFQGKYTVMCHYPIARFDRMGYGSYHLHGHTHGNYGTEGRTLDVGIDARPTKDMGLWEFDEIVEYMGCRSYNSHH